MTRTLEGFCKASLRLLFCVDRPNVVLLHSSAKFKTDSLKSLDGWLLNGFSVKARYSLRASVLTELIDEVVHLSKNIIIER